MCPDWLTGRLGEVVSGRAARRARGEEPLRGGRPQSGARRACSAARRASAGLWSASRASARLVVNIRPVGQAAGGGPKIFDRLREMPQCQMSAAAEVVGLAIVGGELDHLVQSRQRLIGLVPRQLDGGDPQADFGVVRFEFQGSEVFRQRLVRLSDFASSKQAQGEVGLGTVGVDLDRRLESLERRGATSPCWASTCPRPIKAST